MAADAFTVRLISLEFTKTPFNSVCDSFSLALAEVQQYLCQTGDLLRRGSVISSGFLMVFYLSLNGDIQIMALLLSHRTPSALSSVCSGAADPLSFTTAGLDRIHRFIKRQERRSLKCDF